MKSFVLAAAAFALLGAAPQVSARADGDKPSAPAAEAKPLVWSKDFEAAKAQAKKEHKGLFVYLTPDWFP